MTLCSVCGKLLDGEYRAVCDIEPYLKAKQPPITRLCCPECAAILIEQAQQEQEGERERA